MDLLEDKAALYMYRASGHIFYKTNVAVAGLFSDSVFSVESSLKAFNFVVNDSKHRTAQSLTISTALNGKRVSKADTHSSIPHAVH